MLKLIIDSRYPKYVLEVFDDLMQVRSFHQNTLDGKIITRIRHARQGVVYNGYKLWNNGVNKFFSMDELEGVVKRYNLQQWANARREPEMNKSIYDVRTSGVLQTGQWIVGSINKTTNAFSAAATPAIHTSESSAKTEAARLAGIDKSKKYVVLKIAAIASTQDVNWE